ncbi:MAG: hypothetical protein KJ698_06095 [Actinobacteria bacterium]|nr:hypothetical protein [Actinomycetota bacterium]MBU1495026.1 hypothetical protein [Actinomycetota bacterium]
MTGAKRSIAATFLAFLLVGVGVVAIWLVTGSGIFASSTQLLSGPLPADGSAAVGAGAETALPLAANVQVAQPRDPFAPLTTVATPTTTTLPGQTTTTVTTQPGETTTTTPGESTTTTTEGFQPQGTRVVLLEIRQEGGVDKAVMTVDGVTYVVGVGETFAGSFKVVSLAETSGVFLYGDTAFTLAIGQAILK